MANETTVIFNQSPTAALLPDDSGILGLISSGAAVSGGVQLNTAYRLTNFNDLQTLKIDAAYDTTNNSRLFKHLKDIYLENASAIVWIYVVAAPATFAAMLDNTGAIAPTFLQLANNEIKILGVTKYSASAVSVAGGNYDPDVTTGKTNAQALATSVNRPFQLIVLIEGMEFTGVNTTIPDLRAETNKNVGVVLGGTESGGRSQALGLAMGRLSRIPVNMNITRDEDDNLKAIPYAQMYYGTKASNLLESNYLLAEELTTKGYITATKVAETSGNFWDDDPNAVALTNPFNSISLMRVAQKAERIIKKVYAERKNSLIELETGTGFLTAGSAKSLEGICRVQLVTNMQGADRYSKNVTNVDVFIPLNQNVRATSKIIANVNLTAYGQTKSFEVNLSYE